MQNSNKGFPRIFRAVYYSIMYYSCSSLFTLSILRKKINKITKMYTKCSESCNFVKCSENTSMLSI